MPPKKLKRPVKKVRNKVGNKVGVGPPDSSPPPAEDENKEPSVGSAEPPPEYDSFQPEDDDNNPPPPLLSEGRQASYDQDVDLIEEKTDNIDNTDTIDLELTNEQNQAEVDATDEIKRKPTRCERCMDWIRSFCAILFARIFHDGNCLLVFLEILTPTLLAFAVFGVFTSGISWKQVQFNRAQGSRKILNFPEETLFSVEQQFKEKYADHAGNVLILFTPVTEFTVLIMQCTIERLGLQAQNNLYKDSNISHGSGIIGVGSDTELYEWALYHKVETEKHREPVGVIFKYSSRENNINPTTKLPLNVSYSISIFDTSVSLTEEDSPFIQAPKNDKWQNPYISSGFIALQFAVEDCFIRLIFEKQKEKEELELIKQAPSAQSRSGQLDPGSDEDFDEELFSFLSIADEEDEEAQERAEQNEREEEKEKEAPENEGVPMGRSAQIQMKPSTRKAKKSMHGRPVKTVKELPQRILKMFTADRFGRDDFRRLVTNTVTFSFVLSYCFLSVFNVGQVGESANDFKEMIKEKGLCPWMHWVVLFIHAVLYRGLTSLLIVWAITWDFGNGSIVKLSKSIIIYLIIFIHQLSLTFMNFFIGVFIPSTPFAIAVAVSSGFFSFCLPEIFYEMNLVGLYTNFMLIAVFPNWCLRHILRSIIDYENDDKGVSWKNIFVPANSKSSMTCGLGAFILLSSGAIYFIVACFWDLSSTKTSPPFKWYQCRARCAHKHEDKETPSDNSKVENPPPSELTHEVKDAEGTLEEINEAEVALQVYEVEEIPVKKESFCTLFKKRMAIFKRDIFNTAIQFLLPLIVMWVAVLQARVFSQPLNEHPYRAINLQSFNREFQIYYRVGINDVSVNYRAHMKKILDPYGIFLSSTEDVFSKIYTDLSEAQDYVGYVKDSHMVAFEFRRLGPRNTDNYDFVGYFASSSLHSPPLTLNLMSNMYLSILSSFEDLKDGQRYRINVINDPMPQIKKAKLEKDCGMKCTLLAILGSFSIAFLCYPCAVGPFQYRKNELAFSVRSLKYWAANYVFDALLMLILTILIVGIYLADYFTTFYETYVILTLWLISVLYLMWSGLLYSYFMSSVIPLYFNGTSHFLTVIHLVFGILLEIFLVLNPPNDASGIFWRNFFILFAPPYTITYAFFKFYSNVAERSVCRTYHDYYQKVCDVTSGKHKHYLNRGHHVSERKQLVSLAEIAPDLSQCCPRICLVSKTCYKKPDLLNPSNESWASPGLTMVVCAFIIQGFIYLILLIISDKRVVSRLWGRFVNNAMKPILLNPELNAKYGKLIRGEPSTPSPTPSAISETSLTRKKI